jgi:hypothetical protein
MTSNDRQLSTFICAIDSKRRACDLARLQMQDVCHGGLVAARTTYMLQKTQRSIQVKITEHARENLET